MNSEELGYYAYMKATMPLLLVVSSVLIGSVVQAQIQVRPGVRPAQVAEWHAVAETSLIFRYDARSGLTQQMAYVSKEKGIGFRWDNVNEDASLPAGTGPFEVIAGNKTDAVAVRIDRSSGQTWIMYSVKGGLSRWEAVKTK